MNAAEHMATSTGPDLHLGYVTTALPVVASLASSNAGRGADDLAPSTPTRMYRRQGRCAADDLASRRAKVVAPTRRSAPVSITPSAAPARYARERPTERAWVMMPWSAADFSSRERHDMPSRLAGAAPRGSPDGAVTSHLSTALRYNPLAVIERASGMDHTPPEASRVGLKRIAFAKPRPFDRAATALWQTVGVRADCRDLARNAHQTEEWSRPTAIRQDKSREVRPGRTVEELKQINHFARGALWHRTSALRTSYWKTKTTCTSRAAIWRTWPADNIVALRIFWPFCPGRAAWQTAATPRLRSWMCA
jgi:hypothetical protein